MLHIILEPSLSIVPHILKDYFDFLERFDTACTEDTLLSCCHIRSLNTSICHDVFYKTIFYHQIKGTTMGTIFVVVGSNLTAACFKETCLLFSKFIPKTFNS